MTTVNQPPLPTRNLFRLVQNLQAIAERRRLELRQREQNHEAKEDTDNSKQDTSSGCTTNAHLPRFKGRLPSEVSLAELTAEFQALSVNQLRQTEREERKKYAVSAPLPWQQLAPGDSAFQGMLPSQLRHVHGHDVTPIQAEVRSLPSTDELIGRTGDESLSGSAAKVVHPRNSPQDTKQKDWTMMAGADLMMSPPVSRPSDQLWPQPQPQLQARSWAALAAPSSQVQKQMLGERLFPLIQRQHPGLAGKITGMLLEIDNCEVLHMLQNPQSLQHKVQEALAVLQAHQAREETATQREKTEKTMSHSAAQSKVLEAKERMASAAAVHMKTNDPKEKMSADAVRQKPVMNQTVVFPFTEPLTASMLAAAPPQEQKQMLGERLFPLIQRQNPDLAGKITGMLLEIDNCEVLHMLKTPSFLQSKVEEAVAVLQAHARKPKAAGHSIAQAERERFRSGEETAKVGAESWASAPLQGRKGKLHTHEGEADTVSERETHSENSKEAGSLRENITSKKEEIRSHEHEAEVATVANGFTEREKFEAHEGRATVPAGIASDSKLEEQSVTFNEPTGVTEMRAYGTAAPELQNSARDELVFDSTDSNAQAARPRAARQVTRYESQTGSSSALEFATKVTSAVVGSASASELHAGVSTETRTNETLPPKLQDTLRDNLFDLSDTFDSPAALPSRNQEHPEMMPSSEPNSKPRTDASEQAAGVYAVTTGSLDSTSPKRFAQAEPRSEDPEADPQADDSGEQADKMQTPSSGQAPVNQGMSAASLYHHQKQVLTQHLYRLVAGMYPDLTLAYRITATLTQLDNTVLYQMLHSRELLVSMVMRAFSQLQAFDMRNMYGATGTSAFPAAVAVGTVAAPVGTIAAPAVAAVPVGTVAAPVGTIVAPAVAALPVGTVAAPAVGSSAPVGTVAAPAVVATAPVSTLQHAAMAYQQPVVLDASRQVSLALQPQSSARDVLAEATPELRQRMF